MANMTVRIPEKLLQDFDDRVVNSRYKNRSEAVRDLMRRFVDGTFVTIIPQDRRR